MMLCSIVLSQIDSQQVTETERESPVFSSAGLSGSILVTSCESTGTTYLSSVVHQSTMNVNLQLT
jgi:hypothetical protein